MRKTVPFVRRLLALAALSAPLAGGAGAQTVDCNRLAAQISAAGDDAGARRYVEAARKQGAELSQTVAYARSLGCDRQQFLFFGSPPPPECAGVNARIRAMQTNLERLQGAAQGGVGQRARLQQQFDASCQQRGGLGGALNSLFGGSEPARTYPPMDPGAGDGASRLEEEPPADPGPPRGGSQAVCVRTCDGGFFPVSYNAGRAVMADLQELCSAQCPGTEAKIYTKAFGADISKALSAEGEPYANLAHALQFQKSWSPTCSCKPKDQSWAQALQGAEQLIEGRKGDISVTPELAEQLSRGVKPKTAAPQFDPEATRKFLAGKKTADDRRGGAATVRPPVEAPLVGEDPDSDDEEPPPLRR